VVDCGDALAQATANLATVIEEAGAVVEAGPLPSVRGEPALLAAVFQNLVGNAVKFHGEEPPKVTLSAVRQDDFWAFTCADNGIGIEPEYAERVFVIFQRLHPKDAYPGTGIGLAMCRKIIEFHGGRIWLDTDAERGAVFRFTLPVVEEEQ
jgi:light-regulated signal transduction histidine kinase (bacteriophytochrome)